MPETNLNKDADDHKKIFSGFFYNLNNISTIIFTFFPTIAAWYLSKDFKIMLIVFIICISATTIYTIKKNSKSNENLIKNLQIELDEYKSEVDSLKNNLNTKINEIKDLKRDLEDIKSNRETILDNFYIYQNEVQIYKNAYNSAKSGMIVLSNMQKNHAIKDSIKILFENIEKEQIERDESFERSI